MRRTGFVAGVLAVSLLGFSGGGCGGGSSGGGASLLGLFGGTYRYAGFSGQAGGPDVATGQWGTLTANGAGLVTGGSQELNANGLLDGPNPFDAFAYDVSPGRRLRWMAGAVPFAEGGISADGRAAALAPVLPGSSPGLYVVSLVHGTFDASSLSGLYHFAAMFYSGATLLDVTHVGELTFDGVGAAAGTADTNVGGTVSTGSAVGGTYTVGADGKVHLVYAGLDLRGGMLEGGDLVVLGGATSPGTPPAVMVLVRGATAAGVGTLSGAYHAVALSATPGPATVPAWGSLTTTAAADGTGTITFADAIFNVDGDVSIQTGGAFGYTVAADGRLDVAFSEATTGGVSPGGGFAVFGGATGAGDAPILWFLMR